MLWFLLFSNHEGGNDNNGFYDVTAIGMFYVMCEDAVMMPFYVIYEEANDNNGVKDNHNNNDMGSNCFNNCFLVQLFSYPIMI